MAAPKAPIFEFPRPNDRTTVLGRTGSGKTQFATWLLSQSDFHQKPWIIVDYKGDELLNAVDRIKEINLTDKIPEAPGIYIVHPDPEDDDEIEKFLRNIWRAENTGVYFDELYMIPDRGAFRALLTQGRSKNIPVISLSQRPAWVSKFAFTEAEHISIFHLQHKDDRVRVSQFVPDDKGLDLKKRLPDFHSRWYSLRADHIYHFAPVPDAQTIVDTIDGRLKMLNPPKSWA